MLEQTGIAGLPIGEATKVTGMPVDPTADPTPSEWPMVLVMAAVAILGAFLLVRGDWGEYDSGRPADEVARSVPGTTPLIPPAGAEEAAAAAPGDFTEEGAFRVALEAIGRETSPNARVQLMRVDRGQVWAVLDVRGKQQIVRVTAAGVEVGSGGEASSAETRLSDIDPAAPQRIVRGLKERYRVRAAQFDYVALAGWTGTWNAFVRGRGDGSDATYTADAHGRRLKRQ